MPRYIDAEDFFDTFPEIDKIPYSSWAVTHIVDVRPVIRGKWIEDALANNIYRCSECGIDAPVEPTGGTEYKSNYCPNCGSYNGGDTE